MHPKNYLKIYETEMTYLEVQTIYKTCITERESYYIDRDNANTYFNAVSSSLKPEEPLFQRLYSILQKHDDTLKLKNLQRAGVNVYLPNTKMYYHIDRNVTTAVFYINPRTHIEDGGETQFIMDDEIITVVPKPGRLIIFDGDMRHTGSSFNTMPRITIYFKFYKGQ